MPDSVFELLPTQLLFPTLALSATHSRLPAVCRALSPAEAFRPGEQPYRIWLHRAIFIEPRVDRISRDPLNGRHPSVWQMESHVADFFQSLAPACDNEAASGMAPDGPLPSQSLITKQFVHWMFGNAGPFGPRLIDVGSNQDVVAGLAAIRGSGRPVGASRAQDDGIALPKPPKYPLPTWRLVPDAFLLVNLLIRTSQFDSLEFALERLLGMFPSLRPNTCMAPLTTWSHFRLDNRSRLQLDTAFMAHLNGDVHMSCSTYLCILALWDWSLPAITIIERIFTAEHINLTAVARQTISEFSIFRGMLSTLTHLGPSEPCMSNRVLSVLNWLHSHDAFVDSNLIPLVSVFIQNNYPTFANVFLEHDAPKLEHLPIGPGNHHFDFLGDLIATFALEGHTSVLQVALERQLLSEPVKKRLLSKAAKNPGKKWAAEVFRCLAKDGDVAAKVLRVFYR